MVISVKTKLKYYHVYLLATFRGPNVKGSGKIALRVETGDSNKTQRKLENINLIILRLKDVKNSPAYEINLNAVGQNIDAFQVFQGKAPVFRHQNE